MSQKRLIWNKALPSEQTHTVTHKSCNIITDNSCIACPCWYPFWYIYISPPPPYPTIYFHACIHSPSLPSPRLSYPILPSISLLSLPLLSPQLPSPTLSYPLISSTPFPHLPSTRISSPLHPSLPYPTTLLSPSPPLPLPSAPLSHHSLLSPNPLTWRTLPCHLPSPAPPISSPFSPPLGHLILPTRTYPTILSHFLPYPRTPSAPLPYLSSHLLPSPTYPRISYHPLHSHLLPSRPLPCYTLSSPTIPILYPTISLWAV